MTYPTAYGGKAMSGEIRRVRHSAPGTRNESLNKAAYSLGTLVPAHLPEVLVAEALAEAALITTADAKGEDPLRDAEILATIKSGMASGMANPRHIADGFAGRDEALEEVDRITQAWDQTPVGGWVGRRTKQIMAGILRIAYQVGGPTNIPLPITRLGVEAGNPNRHLITQALRDLQDLGWLTQVAPGGPGHAARYTLRVPTHHLSRSQDDPTLTNPGLWERPVYAMTGHDAGRAHSLGHPGLRILGYLARDPGAWKTQAEVARALGVHPGTVGRYTKSHRQLIKHGLVEKNEKGRIRATTAMDLSVLDRAADSDGTLGRRDLDRRRLAAYFMEEGHLDEFYRWLDPRDGSPGNTAIWLLPEFPEKRLEPSTSTSKFQTGSLAARQAHA